MVQASWHGHTMQFESVNAARRWQAALKRAYEQDPDLAERAAYAGTGWRKVLKGRKNPRKRRNAGASTRSATRTATSTKATTTGNRTGTSTGGASTSGGNVTISVKHNPAKGWIPARAVKISRKNGRVVVRIKRR